MNRLFIFDIDGTLTPSRQRMTEDFAKFFDEWSSKNSYYLVTGSDLEKTKEQVPLLYLERTQGIFTCCGNIFYKNRIIDLDGEREIHTSKKYENKFIPENNVLEYLNGQLYSNKYPHRYGNHIENRGSMLNFSIVGRNCTLEQRQEFFEWDNKHKERERIAKEIKLKWSGLDASIGGQISIDIYEKGLDKSQILRHISDDFDGLTDEYIFIGDRTMEGGNDYSLAQLINQKGNGTSYQTKNPENTKKILELING